MLEDLEAMIDLLHDQLNDAPADGDVTLPVDDAISILDFLEEFKEMVCW